jgi:SAM-dependent methyltransferase
VGVPDREERFEAILEALEFTVGPRFAVLDLGCGTGSLSEHILRRFPRARSVAVDYDPVLLTIGKQGLGDLGRRLAWVDADLRRAEWPRHLPIRRFDAAVSTTAMHWLTGPELARLYRLLARLVRPGGMFLNGDSVAFPGDCPRLRSTAKAIQDERLRRARPRGASWEQWWKQVLADPGLAEEARLHRTRYPHAHGRERTPDLDGHIRRLRSAGFREVGLIWTRWDNHVLAAVR